MYMCLSRVHSVNYYRDTLPKLNACVIHVYRHMRVHVCRLACSVYVFIKGSFRELLQGYTP